MINNTDKNSQTTSSGTQSRIEQAPSDISAATTLLFLSMGVGQPPKFSLGQIVATADAVAEPPDDEIRKALVRHTLAD